MKPMRLLLKSCLPRWPPPDQPTANSTGVEQGEKRLLAPEPVFAARCAIAAAAAVPALSTAAGPDVLLLFGLGAQRGALAVHGSAPVLVSRPPAAGTPPRSAPEACVRRGAGAPSPGHN